LCHRIGLFLWLSTCFSIKFSISLFHFILFLFKLSFFSDIILNHLLISITVWLHTYWRRNWLDFSIWTIISRFLSLLNLVLGFISFLWILLSWRITLIRWTTCCSWIDLSRLISRGILTTLSCLHCLTIWLLELRWCKSDFLH